jgi:hypothetical protein
MVPPATDIRYALGQLDQGDIVTDQTPQPAPPPAGWYPVDQQRQRYWDGAAWSEQYAPLPALVLSGVGLGMTSDPKKLRGNGAATAGFVIGVLALIIAIIVGISTPGIQVPTNPYQPQ